MSKATPVKPHIETPLDEAGRQWFRNLAQTQRDQAVRVRDNAEVLRKKMQKLLDLAAYLDNEALANDDHAFRGMA